MEGENWPLFTDEPVEFKNKWLKFKSTGISHIILEESRGMYPKSTKKPKDHYM